MKPLSLKQLRFIEEYLIDQNATQAYLRAGYRVSEKVAAINAHNTLKNPKIAAEIKTRLDRKLRKLEISSDSVLQGIARLAYANIADFLKFDAAGNPALALDQVPRELLAAITELRFDEVLEGSGKDVVTVRKVKIKLADQGANLERLGRYLKLFSDAYQRVNDESLRILRAVRANEMSIDDAAYDFAILGQPLPDVLKVKLAALSVEPPETNKPWTTEQIEARAREMQAGIQKQIDHFLPVRRQEVAALKDAMQANDAFSPADFSGDE